MRGEQLGTTTKPEAVLPSLTLGGEQLGTTTKPEAVLPSLTLGAVGGVGAVGEQLGRAVGDGEQLGTASSWGEQLGGEQLGTTTKPEAVLPSLTLPTLAGSPNKPR